MGKSYLLISALILVFLSVSFAHLTNPLDSLRVHLEGNEELYSEADPSIKLDAKRSGDWVNVTISGVAKPTIGDIVAVYSPANSDPRKTSPLKYKYASFFGKDYLTSGKGVASFKLINLHSDFRFILFRNVSGVNYHSDSALKKYKFVAKSNTVTYKNPQEPNQVHFAFTKIQGQLLAIWNSPFTSNQTFQFGTLSGKYSKAITATSKTYIASQLCGSPANNWGWKDPGSFHSVLLDSLVPSTRYFYRYGNANGGFSSEESFRAPRVSSKPVSFVAFGDLGKFTEDGTQEHWNVAPQSLWTVQHITQLRDRIDFVLHVGDVAYAVGYSAQWDEFMNQIQPISSRVPWMTLPGNHETDFPNTDSFFNGTDSGGECGIPYETRFQMPVSKGKHWYSFKYGPVHVISFSTEHDFAKGSEQYKWMEEDLKKVDRKATPWLVVAGHRPMYAVGFFAPTLRIEVEPLFDKYKVDVAFWGHVHNYERTCPMSKEKCKVGGTTHVVIGMGGYQISQLNNTETYIKKNINESGYSTINADSQSFRFTFFNGQNRMKDEFILFK